MPPVPLPATFDRHLPLLFSVAYRMLGSVADAEEAVRRSRLRWLQAASAAEVHVRSPKAYLSTVVIRYRLDRLRAAPSRREEYVAGLDSSLTTALLSVMESLTPAERTVLLLLRRVFGYDLTEVVSLN